PARHLQGPEHRPWRDRGAAVGRHQLQLVGHRRERPARSRIGSSAGITKPAVERGQTILFAAGNGTANAFETPSPTYGTSTTGPDWNVIVGAIRRDNQRAIIGDGTPAHLSSWGDGNLPSACRTGTVSQCAFGGPA